MKKYSLFIIICLAVVGIILIFRDSKSPGKKEVLIGGIYSLSGDSAVLGQSEKNASELAIEEINSSGGVKGKPFRVIWEDGKCSGKDARTAAEKLISINRVKIILAGGCSSEVLGFSDLTEKENVIVMDITGTSSEITGAGELIFRNVPSDAYSASILASYARDLGFSRAGILREETDYAKALSNTFTSTFTSQGGEVMSVESFMSSSKDIRTQVTKMKEAKPDVLFLAPQSLTTAIMAAKQMKELGISVPLLTTDIILVGESKEFQQAKGLFEGAVISQLDFGAVDRTRLDEFNKKYETRLGKPCEIGEYYCGYGYEMVYLLKGGLEACGDKNECLKKYFYSVKDWPGIMGALTIDQKGDAIRKYTLKRVQDGKVVSL